MAMGPFAVQDLAGIDIAMSSRQVFSSLDDAGGRKPQIIDKLFEAGRLGQKTKAGWYRYGHDGKALPDPVVEAMITAVPRNRRTVTSGEIIERTIYALINEGAKILAQGYALRASDIDLVYLNGYGFPAERGGPMCFADSVGLRAVLQRILEFRDTFGVDWEPAPLLRDLAEAGESFSSCDAKATLADAVR